MTASTLTLTDFLLARIAEDEEYLRSDCGDFARDCQECAFLSGHDSPPYSVDRLLAECEAKRRIVERCSAVGYAMPSTHLAHGILAELALSFADHPDYDEAWRP